MSFKVQQLMAIIAVSFVSLFSFQNCSKVSGIAVTDNLSGAASDLVSASGVDANAQAVVLDENNQVVDVINSADSSSDNSASNSEASGTIVSSSESAPATGSSGSSSSSSSSSSSNGSSGGSSCSHSSGSQTQASNSSGHNDENHHGSSVVVSGAVVVDQIPEKSDDSDSDVASQDDSHDQNIDCKEMAKDYKDAIDIALIKDSQKLALLKGKNFIYSSTGKVNLDDLEIGESCGRTIICGVKIERVKHYNGRIDLVHEAEIEQIVDGNGVVKNN